MEHVGQQHLAIGEGGLVVYLMLIDWLFNPEQKSNFFQLIKKFHQPLHRHLGAVTKLNPDFEYVKEVIQIQLRIQSGRAA